MEDNGHRQTKPVRPGAHLQDKHAAVLGLQLGFDMDSDDQAVHLRLEGGLDPVADGVGLGNAHVAGHDQVELQVVRRPA